LYCFLPQSILVYQKLILSSVIEFLTRSDLSSLEFSSKGSAICLPNLFKERCNFLTSNNRPCLSSSVFPSPVATSLDSSNYLLTPQNLAP